MGRAVLDAARARTDLRVTGAIDRPDAGGLGVTVSDGIAATADAFIRSAPFAAALWVAALLFAPPAAALSGAGAALAVASGALASGLGYSLWNTAMPHLRLSTAGILQISVPPLAAAGGIALLGERPTARLILGGGAIIAGVALAILPRKTT